MSMRLVNLLALAVIAILLSPVLVLIWHTSPHGLILSWHNPATRRAMAISLQSGVVSLIATAGLGIPVSVWMHRVKGHIARTSVTLALTIPLLMPPLVLGLVLAYVLGPTTWTGQWIGATNTFTGLVIAQIYEAVPYFIFAYWGALQTIPIQRQEELSVLGKNDWQIFWYAVWPASRSGLMVAASMAWARIVGAFGAPLVVAYHPSSLPVAIWIRLEETGLPAALALATWLLIVTLPIPLALRWKTR